MTLTWLNNPDGPAAASTIEQMREEIAVLTALISEASIERLATDIAIACVDCRDEIKTARHRAMVRLGERLRNPLKRDLKFALSANPKGEGNHNGE